MLNIINLINQYWYSVYISLKSARSLKASYQLASLVDNFNGSNVQNVHNDEVSIAFDSEEENYLVQLNRLKATKICKFNDS